MTIDAASAVISCRCSGSDRISHLDRLAAIAHESDVATNSQGGLDVVFAGCTCEQVAHGGFDGVDRGFVISDQPGLAVGTVFGLDHQINGDISRVGTTVGDHTDFRRPSERRWHPDDAGHLAFGQRHENIAGADDHIHRVDGVGSIGHCRDGLRASTCVDHVDFGDRRGGERDVDDFAITLGRHAHDDLGDTGSAGDDGGHEDGRWVPRPPTRHITTPHDPRVDGSG